MAIVDAAETHAVGITEIYNDAVLNTTAIWNDILVDTENRCAWLLQRRSDGFPGLVATGPAGQVLGYATFASFRAFDGYRFTVENSVYVRSDARRSGVGRALLAELIGRARGSGKHCMVAAIEAGNTPSLRLHQSMGFSPAWLVAGGGLQVRTLVEFDRPGVDPRFEDNS